MIPTQTIPAILQQALGLQTADLDRWLSPLLRCSMMKMTAGDSLNQVLSTGLYIILAGKIRILNDQAELVISLTQGGVVLAEFIQQTTYQFRAGLGLEMLHVPPQLLRSMLQQSSVADHLKQTLKQQQLQLQEQAKTANNKLQDSYPVADADSMPAADVVFPKPKGSVQRLFQQVTHQYPFVQQQSAVDCGVTCMLMIGLYWGKRLDLNQLRNLANVDRRGATLKGLMIAAEAIGFSARPIKATIAQLKNQPLPAIVHWEGKHYVVVYEITAREVVVADPELGRKRYSYDSFNEGWTGYTLLLQPTAMLAAAPTAKPSLQRFITLLKPHTLVLVEIIMASFVMQVLGLITPIMTQLLLDRVVVQRSSNTLIAIGIGLILFSVFRVALSSLRQYLLDHTANRIDLSLVVGFISHTLRLRLNYFEMRYVGDITSRINENQKIRQFITGSAITTLLDMIMVFVYVGLMVWYSWQMAALALALVPLLFGIALIATPFLQQVSRETFNAQATEDSYLIEVLTGVGTIKAMGLERRVRWRWEQLFSRYIKLNFSMQLIRARMRFASNLVETLVSRTLLLFGIWLVINDRLTIGQLMAFNMLVGNVIDPFMRLIDLWDDFQEVLISVERLNDVLDAPPEEGANLDAQQLILPEIKGHIRFENVSFRYNLESLMNTLENISFEVQPGQTIALVGQSGSGKTTISKLLLGLYLPTDGKVFIDGYDLSTVSLRSLRQQVGVVDQNTFLFGGSIRENLVVGHPDATMADITAAAKLAGADRFIEPMPMRYDSQIGEGGGLLSGGQRQRLAIARALLGNPRLLVLDEATSSLDAETEKLIQENLGAVLNRQTTVIIAHRLSTIRQADLILVLDQGILVESGTHDSLMAKRGQYYHLNQQQITLAT
jgi:ATP-binding cassette subfamily B protein